MDTEPDELTVRAATALLTEWATHRDEVDDERDRRVRIAYASGVGRSRISQLTGLARTTVDRILRGPQETAGTDCDSYKL